MMANQSPYTYPIIIAIFTVILELVIKRILDEFPNLNYKLRYGWKEFWKSFRNAPIDVIYTINISDLTIPFEDYENTLRDIMKSYEFIGKGNENILTYTYKYGNIRPDIVLSYSLGDIENYEQLTISDIQIDLKLRTAFSRFKDEVNDLDKLKQELDDVIKFKLNEVYGESLTCMLMGAYKLMGIPTDMNIKSLYGQLGRNKINLYHDRIVVYDKILSEELNSIKKIITYYY